MTPRYTRAPPTRRFSKGLKYSSTDPSTVGMCTKSTRRPIAFAKAFARTTEPVRSRGLRADSPQEAVRPSVSSPRHFRCRLKRPYFLFTLANILEFMFSNCQASRPLSNCSRNFIGFIMGCSDGLFNFETHSILECYKGAVTSNSNTWDLYYCGNKARKAPQPQAPRVAL